MMLVPVTFAPSVSPTKNVPPVIDTVADVSVALSASLTVSPDDSVTAGPASVYDALAATLPSTGAWSVAVMLTVVVAVVLLTVPSFATQLIVRVVSAPKLLGFWLLDEYATLSST